MIYRTFLCSLAASISFFISIVSSEPVQYCKYGAKTNEIDFCMGMLMHHNLSTDAHDLYLTMTVTRPDRTSLGWTALGLGEIMEGALMFIVYGDPLSSEQPIVSIRKSIGHKQPTLVTRKDMNGADMRVMRADWLRSASSSDSAVAMVSLVCYSCHLWPGTQISATSSSQPWMWAWNSKQEIPVFSYDAHLKMHAHHAGAGGWGNFYVDMARSVNKWHNAPSFPPIRSGIRVLGVSESARFSAANGISWMKHNPVLHLHGIVMGVAFLLLFPIGVIAMRSGSTKSFKYHWMLQVAASILIVLGFTLGLMLNRKINTIHQISGLLIVTSLGIQSILGWRHHIVFLRLRRRTWFSHSHVWLGRLLMVGGWGNLITGMVLRGYSDLCIGMMGSLVGFEALGLTGWLWWVRIKAARSLLRNAPVTLSAKSVDVNMSEVDYFALGKDDSDDEAMGEDLKDDRSP